MKRKFFILAVFLLGMGPLSGCSSLSFVAGHFLTSGKTVPLSFTNDRNSPDAKNTGKCLYHKKRGETCSFPYYMARSVGASSPILLLLIFPISVGLDIGLSPLAFLWGLESGAEHWFMSSTPPPSKKKEKSKKAK